MQCQVDNNGKNGGADDANGRALCVEGDHCKRSGGEGDNGDDDGCLSDWLGFDFDGKFHERSQQQRADGRTGSKEKVCEGARMRERNQGQKR